jgi:hypothetical protein
LRGGFIKVESCMKKLVVDNNDVSQFFHGFIPMFHITLQNCKQSNQEIRGIREKNLQDSDSMQPKGGFCRIRTPHVT